MKLPSIGLLEETLAVTCLANPDVPQSEASIVRLIDLAHMIRALQSAEVLRAWGLTAAEYRALKMLYATRESPLTVTQLAAATGEKLVTLSRVVHGMVARGWVTRATVSYDRRIYKLPLTTEGVSVFERLLPDVSALIERQLSRLTTSEQGELRRLLAKVCDGMYSGA